MKPGGRLLIISCALLASGCVTGPAKHPLHYAIADGDSETVKALVQGGADVDAQDNRGRTPLYYASWYGRPEIAKYILSKGAYPAKGAGWKDSRNALHEAACNGHVDVAKILLAYGMDVNCRTSVRQAPLHLAVERGYPEMVRFLISCGADVDAQDNGRCTALTYYSAFIEKKTEYKDVVEILLDAGADINHVDKYGGTALLAACVLNNKEVVALLLQRGANPNLGKRGTLRPLDYAVQRGYTEIADILTRWQADKARP